METYTCYVLCGIPGSGKSTLSKELSKQYNAKLFCFDDMPDSRVPNKSRLAHEIIWSDVANAVQSQNVVFDDLNISYSYRQKILQQLSNVECKKILYVLTTPLEECIHRNSNRQGVARLPHFVIHSLHSKYEAPKLDEGWDEIIYI